MQVHAEGLQIAHGRRFAGLAAQQPHRGEDKPPPGRSQRMQVIGVGTAQADQPLGSLAGGSRQMGRQLVPLVAGDQRVDQVEPEHADLDAGSGQPAKREGLE